MISPYLLIKKKRDGNVLSAEEIQSFVTGYVAGTIPDYQMAAFLMAVFFKGLSAEETAALTQAMMQSGDTMNPSDFGSFTADKHSTGGVGDKISIVLAPLAAAAGLKVPMMSGRGLGHTGGTLDKLESIPGFTTRLNREQLLSQVKKIGVAMIGQTDRMVPADKKMYALRDVTACVDCIPLIASSIMSKKIAAGPQNLVLDVKVGRGAFMTDIAQARILAQAMVDIGTLHGRNVKALLTNMHTQPLGNAVGNSLEIIESIQVLRGEGAADIRELTLTLTAAMMSLSGLEPDEEKAYAHLEKLLDQGVAYEKFKQLVKEQHGNIQAVEPPYHLPLAKNTRVVNSPRNGFIAGIHPFVTGIAAIELGAGRLRQDDSIDPGVGFWFMARAGDYVHKGDPLVKIYYSRDLSPDFIDKFTQAFEFSECAVSRPGLILEKIDPRRG